MKTCTKCKLEKDKSEFSKDKSRKDGFRSYCKQCAKEYRENNKNKMKEYRENNKDKTKEYQKEYYENNKDKIAEYQKEWYENNKDKRKEYGKEWYENNKDKRKEYGKEYYENNKDKRKEYGKEYYENKKSEIRKHAKNWSRSSSTYNIFANQISYAEEVRKDPENKVLLQVKCTYCGKWFNPKNNQVRHRINALNGKGEGEGRFYCSNECKKLCPIYKKVKYSAEETNTKNLSREVQPELRQMVFERDEWTCIKCGETVGLQCHHIEGIQWNPIESADIDICVTFCVGCHEKAHKDKGCRYVDLQCK